jgi:hypothetical protein
LTSQTLQTIEEFVALSKQLDFAQRIEKYLLFINTLEHGEKANIFPSPPSVPIHVSCGDSVTSFMYPSGNIMREIRQKANAVYKDELRAAMYVPDPGKIIGIDSNYSTLKHSNSAANVLVAIVSKSGPYKGRILSYGVFTGAESHKKYGNLYRMVADRPGYKERIKQITVDSCCENRSESNLANHELNNHFEVEKVNGDIFHAMKDIFEATYECCISGDHRLDFHKIFFKDLIDLPDMDKQYPGKHSAL